MKSSALLPSNLPRVIDRSNLWPSPLFLLLFFLVKCILAQSFKLVVKLLNTTETARMIHFFRSKRGWCLTFFFSWSEGSSYRLRFFFENGIKWCLLKPFSADCMFRLIWGWGAIEAPKSRVCDWWVFPSFRGIMPGQDSPTISPFF